VSKAERRWRDLGRADLGWGLRRARGFQARAVLEDRQGRLQRAGLTWRGVAFGREKEVVARGVMEGVFGMIDVILWREGKRGKETNVTGILTRD
jgi:hypothetical protein